MLKDFRAFQLAKMFYQTCSRVKTNKFHFEQLQRASSSVALNIAEGSGKRTAKDQRRFYAIALGSLRECEAILELEEIKDPVLTDLMNQLGAILFKLSGGHPKLQTDN
jgi:four helix bundle protein